MRGHKIQDEFTNNLKLSKYQRYYLRRKRDMKCMDCGRESLCGMRCDECARFKAIKQKGRREDAKARKMDSSVPDNDGIDNSLGV